jgi:uncharacterized coiled-coil protein SlyX
MVFGPIRTSHDGTLSYLSIVRDIDSENCWFPFGLCKKFHPMDGNRTGERLVDLEMAVSHLEHQIEQIHSVLLGVQGELRTARALVLKLERRIDLVEESESLENDERPPHY